MSTDCNSPSSSGIDTSILPFAFGLNDRTACMSACVAHFITVRASETSPEALDLSPICPKVQSGPAQDLWSLYCCDMTFCGLQIPPSASHGQSNSVDNVISTCQNFGYFAIHDPGPPPSGFSCMSPQNANSFWIPCTADVVPPAILPAVDESESTINTLDGNPTTLSTNGIPTSFLHATSVSLLLTQTEQNTASINTQPTLPSNHPTTALVPSVLSTEITQTGPTAFSSDTQSLPTPATATFTNNSHPANVSEGAKAGIVAGCILSAGLFVAILLCCVKQRRQRAESLDLGAAMAAATLSHATFDSYSIDRPSSSSNSRLFLVSSLTANNSPLSPPLSPPPRLGERRMLSLSSHGGSSHGSLATGSSDEKIGIPGGYVAAQSQSTAAVAVDTGRRPSLPAHGSQSNSPAATSFPGQSWPLSAPPAVLINSNNSNHSLGDVSGCRSPPPLSPLPRLPVSPPSSPQPTSPLVLTVSPPASPQRGTVMFKTADSH